jgi:uncharacterized membrane protein
MAAGRTSMMERLARYLDTERFPLTAFAVAVIVSAFMRISGFNFFLDALLGVVPAYLLGFLVSFVIGVVSTFFLRKLCNRIYNRDLEA